MIGQQTNSTNFPTTPGAFQTTNNGSPDAFVTKLNPAGSGLLYSTYLGGSDGNYGYGIAVDAAGDAYVTGFTGSTNFPTTPGAFQTTNHGSPDNAFVTKLNPAGSGLLYSTYLGGSDYAVGVGIAVDAAGDAYVIGYTGSTNFPTTAGAFQTTNQGSADAFVTKLTIVTFAGTPGFSNCLGRSVAALAHQYGNINAAYTALGFSSVRELETAITAFCGG